MAQKKEPLDLVKLFYQQDIDFDGLEEALKKRETTAKNFTSYSLDPFDGDFGYNEKRHLLNRSVVGYATRHMNDLEGFDIQQSIDLLFTPETLEEPRNIHYWDITSEEYQERYGIGDVGPNEPYVNTLRNNESISSDYKGFSTFASFYMGMYHQNTSIHWKLFLFLHNLVPVRDADQGYKGIYDYGALIFNACFSSYKTFIRNITLNPNMLIYLNLQLSRKETPDENYAREIQELFTQGKRPRSQFTEEDVRGISRALVGWRYVNDTREFEYTDRVPLFDPGNHDTGDKHFSSYYNNRIIRGRTGTDGEQELDEVIDMLFDTEDSGKYIVRRLYQFFVYPVVTDEIESQIIEPLAQIFKDNNYSLIEPLKVLLKSKHFFSSDIQNSIIKPPIDFMNGMAKEVSILNGDLYHWTGDRSVYKSIEPEFFGEKEKDPSYIKYMLTQRYMFDGNDIGQRFLFPPSVSGWPAYYQAPVYDLFWINSTTSPQRSRHSKSMFLWGLWINTYINDLNVSLSPNYKNYLLTYENPRDINSFFDELLDRFLKVGISESTHNRLKNNLLNGNSEQHWTEGVNNLLSDSPEVNQYRYISERIGETLHLITTLGEYQLH